MRIVDISKQKVAKLLGQKFVNCQPQHIEYKKRALHAADMPLQDFCTGLVPKTLRTDIELGKTRS